MGPTMADVARRAGVSRALVSIVMRGVPGASQETRERVLRAADEIGYIPDDAARRLSRARSGSGALGVVFGVGHAFHQDLLERLYVHRGRFDLVLSGVTGERTQDEAIQTVLRERCEGVLLLGGAPGPDAWTTTARQLPVVSVLRDVRVAGVDRVLTQEAVGMAHAVDHLVDLGHRRIVHVHGGGAAGARARHRGHDEAMRAAGLAVLPPIGGGLTEEEGARAADELLARGLADGQGPTALTVFNDRCALGLVDRLRSRGQQVPQDVSVVGFDDIRAAGYAHVGLTTIRQDADRLAQLAVARVAERIERPELRARRDLVAPELVLRSTTAPPDM